MGRRSTCIGRLALASLLASVPVEASTGFVVARRDVAALAGANVDSVDPRARLWFVPGDERGHGRVCFGPGVDTPLGGMNAAGLFFQRLRLDGPAHPRPADKKTHSGNALDRVMGSCSTVDEVVRHFRRYDLGFGDAHVIFGDATGAAAIVERGAIHKKTRNGRLQVATGFRLSTTTPQEAGCPRHRAVTESLGECEAPSLEDVRAALSAASGNTTVYSTAYDLANADVYVYLSRDFRNAVRIDLAEELAEGAQEHDLAEFFELRLLRQAMSKR
jgi:choloylglycine hydrolase